MTKTREIIEAEMMDYKDIMVKPVKVKESNILTRFNCGKCGKSKTLWGLSGVRVFQCQKCGFVNVWENTPEAVKKLVKNHEKYMNDFTEIIGKERIK